MKLVLVPCARTEWRDEGRLLGRTELSPLEGALERSAASADVLKAADVGRLLHGPDELSSLTARALAKALGVQARPLDELTEVDTGLWTGLTRQQLETRYETAFHELLESPLNVQPPGGEALSDAAERLTTFFRKRIRRLKPRTHEGVGVILRPLGFALSWTALAEREPATIWETMQTADEPVTLDLAPRAAVRPRAKNDELEVSP